MRLLQILTAFTLAVGLPLSAAAQEPQPPPDPAEPVVQPEPERPVTLPEPLNGRPILERAESHWLASGFIGTSFASDADSASFDFGGNVGYLWRGVLGGEFQANFSPNFNLVGARSALLLGESPSINTYMVNAIAALPVGAEAEWRPYISGGLGTMTLGSDVLVGPGATSISDSRGASNIGFGVIGYTTERMGVRGDLRYFNAGGTFDPTTARIGEQALADLSFWRANIGLAFRW